MRWLLAIDPGNVTGWAFFQDLELVSTGITSVDAPFSHPSNSDLVIEIPQVYRSGKSKGDPNDLIKVAVEAGRWIERAHQSGNSVKTLLPNQWKGQLPKEVCHARINKVLTEKEKSFIPKMCQTKAHNMMDAIGLGLFQLGRLPKQGVF